MHYLAGVRRLAGAFTLLFLTLYPALAFQIYSPVWYQVGCDWHGRCEQRLGEQKTDRLIGEITRYWRHQGDLSRSWSRKEQRHLAEVREIYDALVMAYGFTLVLALWLLRGNELGRLARYNALAIPLLLLVLPFFKTFWVEVFHPLLFDNELWRNTRRDISWSLMPKAHFQLSAAALIAWAFAVNLGLALIFRRPPGPGEANPLVGHDRP